MNKKVLAIILFTFLISPCFGQKRMLEYSDISTGKVYPCEDRADARVIIECFEPFDISFDQDTKTDELTDIQQQTEVVVGGKLYSFIFPTIKAGSSGYGSRVLKIYAPDFQPLIIPLGDLEAKTERVYKVYDPYNTIGQSPYLQYRDKGNNLFSEMKYDEAIVQYEYAKNCPEYENKDEWSVSIDKKIIDIDSIITNRVKGDSCYNAANFRSAHRYYTNILYYSGNDEYAKKRALESSTALDNFCQSYFQRAEALFAEKEYKEALKLYQKIVSASCPQTIEASERIRIIGYKETMAKQNSTVITYEYAQNVPIGFSIGAYKDKKWSGYFTLHFNSDIFRTIRSEYDKVKKPEVDISFGWTSKKIAPKVPLWIFFGPGYTGMGEYVYEEPEEGDQSENPEEQQKPKLKFYSAVSPEIGILGKYKFISARYTFQYRFSIEKKYEEYMGKTKHFIGIGVAF